MVKFKIVIITAEHFIGMAMPGDHSFDIFIHIVLILGINLRLSPIRISTLVPVDPARCSQIISVMAPASIKCYPLP
jgi:hypothetical protein